jgi:hypothetical protein
LELFQQPPPPPGRPVHCIGLPLAASGETG